MEDLPGHPDRAALASQAMSRAASSGVPIRPIGHRAERLSRFRTDDPAATLKSKLARELHGQEHRRPHVHCVLGVDRRRVEPLETIIGRVGRNPRRGRRAPAKPPP
jgi:hypothetical protein